ncbi:MAG: NAD-dependent epimerase/dehydratase family protein [Pseudomonas sp.]
MATAAGRPRRALVTGAGGFTGRYLMQELEAHGWEVWGLGHGPVAGDERILQADLLAPAALQAALEQVQPEAVFHLAAIAFVGHGTPADFYQVNLIGTRNLLAALAALPQPPASVLLASSANVYGNAAEGMLDESTPFNPANDYAVSKAAMEMMARLWCERLPLVVVRPFNYTGVGQSLAFLVPKIVDHFHRRASFIELGNLQVWRDFSDVRDVVRAYRLLADACPAGQTVNICSGRSHSLMEVLDLARQISGHELQVQVNPAFVRANEVRTLYGDAERLGELLGGWSPRPFADTLAWMLAARG